MTIDERALEAATFAVHNAEVRTNGAAKPRELARVAIEAYEVALWKPIAEAPKENVWIEARKPGNVTPMIISWDGEGWTNQANDFWKHETIVDAGVMYRKIYLVPFKTQKKDK